MADAIFTTITLRIPTARRLRDIAKHRGLKTYAVGDAWERGWSLLTEEQQNQALAPSDTESPLGSPLDPDTADPRREGLRLGCDATRLNVALDEMLRDEQIDKAEGRRLREYLRQIVKRAENIDRASTRKRSRKGAAA